MNEPQLEQKIEKCTYMKKITNDFGGFSKPAKQQCDKPQYMAGLCKEHFDRHILRHTPWSERPNYRDATMDDLLGGKILMIKHRIDHVQYGYRRKMICKFSSKLNMWLGTDMEVSPDKFCVRK
jgi:hypothetical protein